MCKIFADDTSIFSKVLDVNKSVIELNVDLEKTNELIKGKCNLTLSPINKQVIFSRKHISYNLFHPPIKFNERIVTKCNHQNI